MTYFGGLGTEKGWYKFKFILTPNEFKDLFEGLEYRFVITNTRIPIDYSINDKDSIFKHYQFCYAKVTSGDPWVRKEDWKRERNLSISITQDTKMIQFQEIRDEEGRLLQDFKSVEPQGPVINISPFYLRCVNDKLSIEILNEEGILGLELNFPKVVTFHNEGFEKIHETGYF
ncbi:hypothetical protein [Leptospira alstonii]|uniref:hypothetical protein n=1 Tax=Leptospira alstonii TaxID=28452 RepID=UPI000774CB5D|nr:hypothetical protein [Leptospira alstonii]